jgi:four helix bundle protein
MARSSKGQDIRDRTFQFGVRIVKMTNRLPRTVAGYALARQVIRSGTGIGANVEEADAAESNADFVHRMKPFSVRSPARSEAECRR